MASIVIVVGHVRSHTYCEALGNSYADGARRAGHSVSIFVTGAISFDPILHYGFERVQSLEPDLQAAHDAIMAADHLVFIFPLWLGTLPAIFKGFLERVVQPDLVEPSKQQRFVKLWKGKSARIVITMGMPAVVYRLWFRAHALKMLKRNILQFMGVHPVRSMILGNIEGVGLKGRERWLGQMEALGRRAA
jgi:NAD(P)H dehydrogenase (quinone)